MHLNNDKGHIHIPPIDNLIDQSTRIFKQFLLAQNALNIGGNTILGFSDNALIGAIVGVGIEIEPIPIFEEEQRGRWFKYNLTQNERWSNKKKGGTLVQIELCIAKEKILTAARWRGYWFKQKLTLPNGRSRIHLDAKITKRFRI